MSDVALPNTGLPHQLNAAIAAHRAGRLETAVDLYRQILTTHPDTASALTNLGSILRQQGQLEEAIVCLQQAVALPDANEHAAYNLGNALRAAGRHAEAVAAFQRAVDRKPAWAMAYCNLGVAWADSGNQTAAETVFRQALAIEPEHALARSNLAALLSTRLMNLQYLPGDANRLAALAAEYGVLYPNPAALPVRKLEPGEPLRIGFLSPDLCDHPVGLYLLPVLQNLNRQRIQPTLYSTGGRADDTRRALQQLGTWVDVAPLDDAALLRTLRHHALDILIDLSGHTAGHRLPVFASRAAPLQISWLGYFATTGVPAMDYVLMDEWHVPVGHETQFSEQLIRLPQGRFCYQPVPFAPMVSPPPCLYQHHVTFGSFNNTAKHHAGVYDCWAQILTKLPGSRLILKWRNYDTDAAREQTLAAFAERGVAPERIELRPFSYHADLLQEYAEIDIALDPFPFTGGHTSCEALYMGVPVVTWPQKRAVSRQTFAFLAAIGLQELAAQDAEGYVRIAVELANDKERLKALRDSLRQRMMGSPLCDVVTFTRQFEDTLIDLYRNIEIKERHHTMLTKTILHVGPGHRDSGATLPLAFHGSEWQEIRLDIEPANEPDILGTMLDMAAVENASVDAIYSSHNIEHLYPNEIPQAMKEFLRVLKPEGIAVITCPDLQAAAQMIAEDKLMDVAYESPGGTVTPFDIVYSHRNFTGRDKPFMAHHCGFTLKTLMATLKANGFQAVAGKRRPQQFDLWVVASKGAMADAELRKLAGKMLPG